MTRRKRGGMRVSFNDTVSVFTIPARTDEQVSTRRVLGLAEYLRKVASTMNTIDNKILQDDTCFPGEQDVIQRMIIKSSMSPMAKVLSEYPSVKHMSSNIAIKKVEYDNANLRDKVAMDFLNSVIDGFYSRYSEGPHEEASLHNTLYILVNPKPDDFIGNMEHCLVLNTSGMRDFHGTPPFKVLVDISMDT